MLINCPACQHEVSDQAQACPSCGHPLTKPVAAKKKGKLSTAALVVIAGVVGMIIIGEHTSDNKTETAASYDVDHPETITRTIHEERANAVARLDNGKLLLTYSIDPWALTTGTAKSIYYFKAKKFFQDAFRSPVVQVRLR
jgi:uncharacterized OB-fold protein